METKYLLPIEIKKYIIQRVYEDNKFLRKEVHKLLERLNIVMEEAFNGVDNGVFDEDVVKLINEFKNSKLSDLFDIDGLYRIRHYIPFELFNIEQDLIFARVIDNPTNIEKIEEVIFNERKRKYKEMLNFYRNEIRKYIEKGGLKHINVDKLLKLIGLSH